MTAYYNEIEPVAAETLRNLIAAGLIAPGLVDERSIEDVRPDELAGYTQCHFFAGVGIWSYALRQAGWPDDRPVWTGSCPCQPFSAAGKGDGFADERHLWPAWFHLVAQCRPSDIFGEQVASKAAEPWIDLVHADLEALGYAFGSVPFPAAGVGAPHIRDRNYWFASAMEHSVGAGLEGLRRGEGSRRRAQHRVWAETGPVAAAGSLGRLADPQRNDHRPQAESADHGQSQAVGPADRAGGCGGAPGRMADSGCERRQQNAGSTSAHEDADGRKGRHQQQPDSNHVVAGDVEVHRAEHPGPVNSLWRDADWLLCRDGKWRPVEPGTFPLAHGVAGRVGRLRAYGNAINAEAARAFIEAAMT